MTRLVLDRRAALRMGAGVVLAAAGGTAALAAQTGERKLALVILRGALDGLAAVAPFADPQYQASRGRLALDAPGGADGVLPIAEGFGLHPRLTFLHQEWQAGRLAVMHAAATPYRDRSHFDGQDVLESGGQAVFALNDGWLNRALAVGPVRREAVAVAQTVPLVLRGAAPVSSWSPSFAPSAQDDTIARLMDLYAEDALLGPALSQAVSTAMVVGEAGIAGQGGRGGGGPGAYRAVAEAAARLMAAENGPAAGVIAFDGWDTHANQGAAQGQLALRLQGLDAALAALKTGLGAYWDKTVVVVATEFGRTVQVNGTGGTDHGTGGAAFVLGGAVRGGRMLGDWPGLARLHENRDLIPANDLRGLFVAVLAEHWGLDRAGLMRAFPDAAAIARPSGLVLA